MTPLSQSAREGRRERELAMRRADVIAAAASIFADKGFQGAQVAEIATAAELSLNSVYGLFKGKEELYEAVIQEAAATVRDRVQNQVETLDDPRDQLLAIIDSLFECFEDNEDLLRIYSRATHGLPWRVRQTLGDGVAELSRAFSMWVVQITTGLERDGGLRGLDPETLAFSIIGTVTTAASRWIESPGDQPLSEAAPKVRAIFERLLEDR